MSNPTLAMPAARRFALSASRFLERWALDEPCRVQQRREAEAYEQAVADRERFELDALRMNPLR